MSKPVNLRYITPPQKKRNTPLTRACFLTCKVGIIMHPLGFLKIKYYIASIQPVLDQRDL